MSKDKDTLPSLEDALAEINNLVDQMEHSELTLEQSLSHFERGVTLIKHCQTIIKQAEQKVQILINNNQNKNDLEYFERQDVSND